MTRVHHTLWVDKSQTKADMALFFKVSQHNVIPAGQKKLTILQTWSTQEEKRAKRASTRVF